MKRRYYMRQDYMAYLRDGEPDWAVYDHQTKDPDERPLAVFARRTDALKWTATRNREVSHA